jgi:Zn-dependent peptidase ImmA (M78 family)/transcriptional regulator with XRE-family HTH domain
LPNVNPEILRWARITAGLSASEAAEKIGLKSARGATPEERLLELERGVTSPSRPLLLRMSKQYRRPLLTFYLAQPPRVPARGEDFRSLPEDESDENEAILDALLRDIKARQALLRSGIEDDEDVSSLPFVGSVRMDDGIERVLSEVRSSIGMPLSEFRAASNPAAAFATLRDYVEGTGVFVMLVGDLGSHHTALDVTTFRGFCLADPVAPFIVVNDRDSRAAWSFTLVHEFTHLLLGQTGISGGDPELAIERFCNDVASEYLLPLAELQPLRALATLSLEDSVARISEYANARRVSSSMVTYKLFRAGIITMPVWRRLHNHFRQLWINERENARTRDEGEGGPNYYVVRRHRLGPALIETTRRLLSSGALTSSKAAQVLGMKPHQLPLVLTGTNIANRAS